MGKVIAIVGLCGSGKTVIGDFFTEKGCGYVRFGQITLDEVKRRNLEPNEKLEKEIREGFRKDYGMGAFAVLNIPKIDELLTQGHVVADGLYSWSEYKILKEKYGDDLIVIGIYASPKTRYARICHREQDDDEKMRFRSFTKEEAKARDYAEIENIEKAGPIAYADYLVHNEGTFTQAKEQLEKIWEEINHE